MTPTNAFLGNLNKMSENPYRLLIGTEVQHVAPRGNPQKLFSFPHWHALCEQTRCLEWVCSSGTAVAIRPRGPCSPEGILGIHGGHP